MTKVVNLGRAALLCLTLALFSASFTLSGCSADTLSGPDVSAHSTIISNGGGTSSGGEHNEGNDKTDSNGGGTSSGGEHNEGND